VALRIFACRLKGMSAISSKKRVPLLHTSKKPILSAIAPVKEPFLWPKNSLSRSVSVIALLLTAQNRLSFLILEWCIIRAMFSFPVPLSPVIKTLASGYYAAVIAFSKTS
jgi:hypothetical protein